jgi:Outer membrane protein beta-barrel domain
MIKTTSIAVLLAAAVLSAPSPALAQPNTPVAHPIFLNVSLAAQTQSRDIESSSSFPLYGETARIAVAQRVGSGPVFDVNGGYHVTRNFAVGAGFSTFSRTSTGSIAASIPNPLVFNRPATINLEQSGLKHSEVGTHIMALWFMPVTTEFGVTFSGGPSFTHVKQDIASATVVTGTQTANVNVQSQTGTAAGINVGLAGHYMFRPHYGGTAFMRYVSGSVDLPDASDVKVGGFQIGLGFALRY